MSQNNIDFSNDMSGVELLDDYLTPLKENINTSNSGVQRPSYAVAGTKWLDTSVTPWVLKMYDGTDDVALGTLNPTTHLFTPKTPLTTAGDILVQGADDNLSKLEAGVAGTVLTANGAGALPTYQVNPIGVLTYSSSYTYKKNDIVVSTNEDDETALYKSLIDNNIGNALTDNTKWEKLSLGGGVGNIGDIKYTTRTDVPNGGAWCDGTEYTKAAFPDIYQMLVDGKISYTDYTSFSESIFENGSCGFFALDEENEKFKVPLLKDVYLKSGDAPVMFGSESLPNITGSLSPVMGRLETSPVGSGFVYTNNAGSETLGAGTFSLNIGSVNFNASRNSSAYQNGAKVNPDHVLYRAYVVLYSSAAEASETQAQEFITSLVGKANIDLSNVSSNIDYVVESQINENGSFYRKYKSGWIEQGGEVVFSGINHIITLPTPFTNTSSIKIQVTSQIINTSGFSVGFGNVVNNTQISLTSTGIGVALVHWIAMGY